MAKIARGLWSMSDPEGQEPAQVPHCKQARKFNAFPGVSAMTLSNREGGRDVTVWVIPASSMLDTLVMR
jgi:hypothetical protein